MRNRKFIIVVTLGKNGIQEEHIWGFKNISHIPLIKPNGEKGQSLILLFFILYTYYKCSLICIK